VQWGASRDVVQMVRMRTWSNDRRSEAVTVARCPTGTTRADAGSSEQSRVSASPKTRTSPAPSRATRRTNSLSAAVGDSHVAVSMSICVTSARPWVPVVTPVSMRVTPAAIFSAGAVVRWWRTNV